MIVGTTTAAEARTGSHHFERADAANRLRARPKSAPTFEYLDFNGWQMRALSQQGGSAPHFEDCKLLLRFGLEKLQNRLLQLLREVRFHEKGLSAAINPYHCSAMCREKHEKVLPEAMAS